MVTLKKGNNTKHISNPDLIKILTSQGWQVEPVKEEKEVKNGKSSKSGD